MTEDPRQKRGLCFDTGRSAVAMSCASGHHSLSGQGQGDHGIVQNHDDLMDVDQGVSMVRAHAIGTQGSDESASLHFAHQGDHLDMGHGSLGGNEAGQDPSGSISHQPGESDKGGKQLHTSLAVEWFERARGFGRPDLFFAGLGASSSSYASLFSPGRQFAGNVIVSVEEGTDWSQADDSE